MGQAGHQRVVELFSVEQMVQCTETLYKSLLVERAESLDRASS
jgi:hypothetical protein